MNRDITYVHGIPEALRSQAAVIYDRAFGDKFALAIPDADQRIALLSDSFELSFAFAAIADGELAGLAGYRTEAGSLTGSMDYARLLANLGPLRGNWAALLFSLYERSLLPNQLLMDGIAVAPSMRGEGIGTRLLSELTAFAADAGYDTIRLDVIDTNPGARRLYERNDFVATETQHFGYLRWWLGFGASTTLIRSTAVE